MKPGYYRDISNQVYHRQTAGVSSSFLKLLNEHNAAKAQYLRLHPDLPTRAMRLGTACHSLVLEPGRFAQDNLVLKTNSYKVVRETMENNPALNVITQGQYDAAQRMRDNVLSHPYIGKLFGNGWAEVSVWDSYEGADPESGETFSQLIKCRVDFMPASVPYLVDLKTAEDASPAGFHRACEHWDYYLSAAMYRTIANRCDALMRDTGFAQRPIFLFVVVENTPPYQVAWYECGHERLTEGGQRFVTALHRLYRAKRDGWPGYSDKCLVL